MGSCAASNRNGLAISHANPNARRDNLTADVSTNERTVGTHIAEDEQAEVPEATPAPEVTIEEPPAPEPTDAEKQAKTEPVPPTQSEPEPTPEWETKTASWTDFKNCANKQ